MPAHRAQSEVGASLLEQSRVAAFRDDGYLVLPSFLPVSLVDALRTEVDHWVDAGLRARSIEACIRGHRPPVIELEMDEHGWLISYPPLMAILTQLMGPAFAFHHMHSDRHDCGLPGKAWHHDYEQNPQTSRSHVMVHVFFYLTGLDGTIGDLIVLPGSQRRVAGKDALHSEGTGVLDDEVVIDRLPIGSVIIIHSALFHARRARPGGTGSPRYFIDCSYCQDGVVWPAVKPYWREMLARAGELGLDRRRWPHLFMAKNFSHIDPTSDPGIRSAVSDLQPRPT
jgi:ectoine hydroxylase-related dioxygenase (phytanoyl-CoA dioxygenase family)